MTHGNNVVLVHIGMNDADKEGTKAILKKFRNLLKKTKEASVGQMILSGILPVFGIFNYWPEWQLFNVAGYLIEERRRWPVITASPRGQCSK